MTSRAPTAIDQIAENWLTTQVELAPELRVELGWDGDQSAYRDYSPDGFEAEHAAGQKVLGELSSAVVVDAVDEVTLAELRRTIELGSDRYQAGLGLRDLNNLASPAQEIRMVFDLMHTDTDDDWAAIARRMANVPAALAGYTASLREGIARGIVPARRQVAEVITQTRAYAGADGFFAGLAAHDSCGLLASALATGAAQARAAYGQFADFLTGELAPVATDIDAVGREMYQLCSRGFLGATVDLDDAYEWGLAELARMRAEQEACAAEVLPGANVAEASAHLDGDPARKLPNTAALQEWMQQVSDQAVAELGETHFDIPEPMRDLECLIAPTNEGGVYYTGPSDDFARPGRMWWSVPAGVTEFDTWRELTTVYHEGVPGHHLQIARAVYVKDQLNSWRRINGTSGHAEGWALYAERLMEQLGYLADPANRLGMLDGQRLRAARVVLDLGVHLGKKNPDGGVWDFNYAVDFLAANTQSDPETILFEVNRYFGWPGQAPSYKIGQRIWEDLRADAERRPGFDLKAWHTSALDLGGLGLDTLKAALS